MKMIFCDSSTRSDNFTWIGGRESGSIKDDLGNMSEEEIERDKSGIRLDEWSSSSLSIYLPRAIETNAASNCLLAQVSLSLSKLCISLSLVKCAVCFEETQKLV